MNIIAKFEQHFNEENSKYMKRYMKDNFEFLGIRSPLRKDLQKDFFKQIDQNAPIDKELVKELWNKKYREFQYLAIDYLIKENLCDKEFFIEKAIGWSLRDYSKTNKEWVRYFVKNNELSTLSKREASKYL